MGYANNIQKLEPGNLVVLLEVDGSEFGLDIMRFHGHAIAHSEAEITESGGDETKLRAKSIWWQGYEHKPWPCSIEGIESSTDGTVATPTLRVANIDSSITALCLAYQNLYRAKVVIHEIFTQYLDAENFANGNPDADPEQDNVNVFYISNKPHEDDEYVEFTLSSPMDLSNKRLPARQMTSICHWCMRGWYRSGKGCTYNGNQYFDKNNIPVTDPSQDQCNGLPSGCKARFGENNPLPHGGFPSTSLLK